MIFIKVAYKKHSKLFKQKQSLVQLLTLINDDKHQQFLVLVHKFHLQTIFCNFTVSCFLLLLGRFLSFLFAQKL